MFSKKFFDSIRNRKCYVDYNVNIEYNLYDFVKYLRNHPDELTIFDDKKQRIYLQGLENRESTSKQIKQIGEEISKIFLKNKVSIHCFIGLGSGNKSFNIHKDPIDVLYLQVVGDVNFSIWETELDERNIQPEEGTCVYKRKFEPGHWIWVPRGKYHLIEPLGDRVGISFTINGENDPADYV